MNKKSLQLLVLGLGVFLLLYGVNTWRMDITPTVITVFNHQTYDVSFTYPTVMIVSTSVVVPSYASASQTYVVDIHPLGGGGSSCSMTVSLVVNGVTVKSVSGTYTLHWEVQIPFTCAYTAPPNQAVQVKFTVYSTTLVSVDGFVDGSISYVPPGSPSPSPSPSPSSSPSPTPTPNGTPAPSPTPYPNGSLPTPTPFVPEDQGTVPALAVPSGSDLALVGIVLIVGVLGFGALSKKRKVQMP